MINTRPGGNEVMMGLAGWAGKRRNHRQREDEVRDEMAGRAEQEIIRLVAE